MSCQDWFSQMDWGLSARPDTGCGVLRIEPGPGDLSHPGCACATHRAVSAWPNNPINPAHVHQAPTPSPSAGFVQAPNEALSLQRSIPQ